MEHPVDNICMALLAVARFKLNALLQLNSAYLFGAGDLSWFV